jgi:aminocarboxymuconate-semialdehyde decarboxylase
LLAYLDRALLAEAVVAVPPPFYRQHLGTAECAAWVRAVNDGLLRATARSSRLLPVAYLPLEHPNVAIAEIDRLAADPGAGRWVGFAGAVSIHSVSLADPAFEPLWERLHAETSALLLHPDGTGDPRLEQFYLANLLGNPAQTALAAAQLVFSDVMRRYSRMRVVLMHAGGAVPSLAGRWQRGAETARPGLNPRAEPPQLALRRLWADCLAFHPGALDLAIDVFGTDHLVLGTDWPFPMSTDDPRSLVAHRGEAYVRQVAETNATTALGRTICVHPTNDLSADARSNSRPAS